MDQLLIKNLTLFFKTGMETTVNGKVTAKFPANTYWRIASRNKELGNVILQDVQWGTKNELSFQAFGNLLSSFDIEEIFLMNIKSVPKVLHIQAKIPSR